jgi:hypothetical protein
MTLKPRLLSTLPMLPLSKGILFSLLGLSVEVFSISALFLWLQDPTLPSSCLYLTIHCLCRTIHFSNIYVSQDSIFSQLIKKFSSWEKEKIKRNFIHIHIYIYIYICIYIYIIIVIIIYNIKYICHSYLPSK